MARLDRLTRTLAATTAATLALVGMSLVQAPSASARVNNDDDLATAGFLISDQTIGVSTVGATLEASEGQQGCAPLTNSIWFKWTSGATADGPATIDIESDEPGLDTVVNVWRGTSATFPLTPVACNDDQFLGMPLSRVEFQVTANTTYYVQVGARQGSQPGPLLLTLFVPFNDSILHAKNLSGSQTSTATVNNSEARPATAEAVSCGSIARSVWYRVRPQASGQVTATTSSGGAPSRDTVMVVWRGPPTITSFGDLEEVGCSDDINQVSNTYSQVQFQATAGDYYYIQVGTFGSTPGGRFNVQVDVPTPTPAANDALADHLEVTAGVPVVATTAGAGLEQDETSGLCADISNSVWFSWTAPANGLAVFQSSGGESQTHVTLYVSDTDTATHPLDFVSCSGDTLGRTDHLAKKGTTYYIQVGNLNPPAADDAGPGPFGLDVSFEPAPANDDFAGASPLTLGEGQTVNNSLASEEDEEDYEGCPAGFKSLWFSYTPTATTGVEVSAFNSTANDGFVAVLRSPAPGAGLSDLVPVVCDNGNDTDVGTELGFVAQAGTTYYVKVSKRLFEPDADFSVAVTDFAGTPTSTTVSAQVSGQDATLVADVSRGGGPVTGDVEFFLDDQSLGSLSIDGTSVGGVVEGLTPGTYQARAVFTSSNHTIENSTSAPITFTVTAPPPVKVASTTSLKAPAKVAKGARPSVTVTVMRGGAPATGQVRISVGTRVVRTTALVGGKVSLRLPKIRRKTTVRAAYLGNSTTSPSTATRVIRIKRR